MIRTRFAFIAPLTCCAMLLTVARPSQAAFHVWRFTEFFSNSDGSVQFIEIFDTNDGETQIGSKTITSMSTGKTFTFPANLSTNDTDHRNLLIATSNFAALPGAVTPDYNTLPANFFNPAGDTVKLFSGIDSKTFTAPTDGIQSRNYPSNTLANNTPTNFNHNAGFINLSPPPNNGDYNGDLTVDAADYTVWRNTLGMSVAKSSGADGNNNSVIDAGDYTFWKMHYGQVIAGSGASLLPATVPEPVSIALALIALVSMALGWSFLRPVRPRISG